jgi:hypothetical protein
MAALNFPNSPKVNDTYTNGGVIYTWDGHKWTAKGSDPGHVLKAGDTMTGNLTVPSLNGGQIAFRNQIINGSFGINQRGISDTSAQNLYFVDRWFKGNSTGRIVVVETTPPGFDRSLSFSGAVDSPIYQAVELPRTGKAGPYAVGTTWTLSCYARCASGGDVRLGKRFVNDQNQNITDESAQAFTLDANWKHISFTFTIGSAPNAANTGLQILIVALTANELFVTGVQLEPGPVATPPETRPIATELALCQRYYQFISGGQSSTGLNMGAARNTAITRSPHTYANQIIASMYEFGFKSTMRALPSVVVVNPYRHQSGTDGNVSGNWISAQPYVVSRKPGRIVVMYSTTSYNYSLDFHQIQLDAEL